MCESKYHGTVFPQDIFISGISVHSVCKHLFNNIQLGFEEWQWFCFIFFSYVDNGCLQPVCNNNIFLHEKREWKSTANGRKNKISMSLVFYGKEKQNCRWLWMNWLWLIPFRCSASHLNT